MTKEGANVPENKNAKDTKDERPPVTDEPVVTSDASTETGQAPLAGTNFNPVASTTGPGRRGGAGQPLSPENDPSNVASGTPGEDFPGPSQGDVVVDGVTLTRPEDPNNRPEPFVSPTDPTEDSWSQRSLGTVVNPEDDEDRPSREVARLFDGMPPLCGVDEQTAVLPARNVAQRKLEQGEALNPFEEQRLHEQRLATTMNVHDRGYVTQPVPPGHDLSEIDADGKVIVNDQK